MDNGLQREKRNGNGNNAELPVLFSKQLTVHLEKADSKLMKIKKKLIYEKTVKKECELKRMPLENLT